MWGLGRNLYLLAYQPYLTLKEIREKRDKSQFFLITTAVVLPAVVYAGLRIVWDRWRYGTIMPRVGSIFAGVAVTEVIVVGYLAYWTWRVMKNGDS